MINNTENGKKNLSISLICIILLFLANALYILYLVYGDFWRYPGEVLHKVSMLVWILLALLHITSVVGILQRRRFALYSSSVLLMLSIAVSVLITRLVVFAVVGLVIYLFLLRLLWGNETYFKKFDRLDKWIMIVMFLLVISSIAAFHYSLCCVPDSEEYAELVTNEAVEKGDWRVCEKLSYGKSDCIRSIAINKNSAELCEKVSDANGRNNCYFHIGINLKNASICDKIDDRDYTKEWCYRNIKGEGS